LKESIKKKRNDMPNKLTSKQALKTKAVRPNKKSPSGKSTASKPKPNASVNKKKPSEKANLGRQKRLSKYDKISDSEIDDLTVLAIDIGGTKVKMLVSGEHEPRKAISGPEFTPMKLLETVNELASKWKFDAITIGFPGLVGANGPLAEPGNLGSGWVGFDFAGAFQKPVKILNDAAMQAVGSYEGGRMLFLGLGTGLGTTLIVDHVILDVELSELRWNARKTLGELLSKRSIKKLGLKKWRAAVNIVVHDLMSAFVADYVVVGGGNAKLLDSLPAGARLGHNQTAFRGGFRVWGVDSRSSENLDLHGNWRIL
jgi:polyphosphate glucokinase